MLAFGTEHVPATGHFAIIPRSHHVGTRTQHQMKMIGQDRKAEQIDAEESGYALQFIFNPSLSMVVVLACIFIQAH